MIAAIQRHEPLPKHLVTTLSDLVAIANRTIHGEHIRPTDAEAMARVGTRVVEELQQFHMERSLEPISTRVIPHGELDRLAGATYRVTSVTPLVENPILQIRHLDQNGLDEMLEGYNEYAEFLVGIEIIGNGPSPDHSMERRRSQGSG
jgi:hypothetical protein